jgi:nucleoside-diphosphate-sugar epimerase
MKVLVTGATGGLGLLVVEKLLKMGHTVITTSRNTEKAKAASFFNQVTHKPYEISSSSNLENLFEYFEQPEALIHLAWEKLNDYKNQEHLSSILTGHKQFLNNLINNGLKDLTVVGTCYEYGLIEGELEESMQANPTMPYPQAKNLLRLYLEEYKKEREFSLKWLRVFYVFGEIKERKNLYTHLVSAITNKDKIFNMSGGEQVRDFLSPDQIAGTITDVAQQHEVVGVINCCSGQPVKLKEFVQDFLNKNNYQLTLNLGFYPYPDYEPMNTWGSIKKLNCIYRTV